MTNEFDTPYKGVPENLMTGSRWYWVDENITSLYPPANFTITYLFVNLDTEATAEIEAGKVNDQHVVEFSASDVDSDFTEGNHAYSVKVVRDADSEQITRPGGYVLVSPATPERSYAYKTLVAIRAVLNQTASKEQQQYSIAGRQLIRRSTGELIRMEEEFARRVEQERLRFNRKVGKSSRKRVQVKLSGN